LHLDKEAFNQDMSLLDEKVGNKNTECIPETEDVFNLQTASPQIKAKESVNYGIETTASYISVTTRPQTQAEDMDFFTDAVVDELKKEDDECEDPESEEFFDAELPEYGDISKARNTRQFRFSQQQRDVLSEEFKTEPQTTPSRNSAIAQAIGCKPDQVRVGTQIIFRFTSLTSKDYSAYI
jgi:hypothetical protein